MGEDVGESGGIFAQTRGLHVEFGGTRVRDTPIAENGFVSAAVGAAMTGLRPVVETSNTITLAAMVAEGVGITVLPELAARIATGVSDQTADAKLTFVPLSHPTRHRPIGVITRQSKSLSPIARIFLAMVMDQAPKLDLPAAIEWD